VEAVTIWQDNTTPLAYGHMLCGILNEKRIHPTIWHNGTVPIVLSRATNMVSLTHLYTFICPGYELMPELQA